MVSSTSQSYQLRPLAPDFTQVDPNYYPRSITVLQKAYQMLGDFHNLEPDEVAKAVHHKMDNHGEGE